MTSPFDYTKAINETKENLIVDESSYKDYPVFMVLRSLSYYVDTVMQANEMNKYQTIPKNMINDFLLHSIRQKKRYSKWTKKETSEGDLGLVSDYYNVSRSKAESMLELMKPEHIEFIKEQFITGGKKRN